MTSIENRQGRQARQIGKRTVEPDRELDELAHRVIGAAIEVHRGLGSGYLESVYEEAMAVEMGLREIPFERQRSFEVLYKDRRVGEGRLDFLVGGRLVVELKTVDQFAAIHFAQVLDYLKAGSFQLGLLINFKSAVLRDGIQRIVLS